LLRLKDDILVEGKVVEIQPFSALIAITYCRLKREKILQLQSQPTSLIYFSSSTILHFGNYLHINCLLVDSSKFCVCDISTALPFISQLDIKVFSERNQ